MAVAVVPELLNPVDVVHEMVLAQQWPFHHTEDELTFYMRGNAGRYQMAFTWLQEQEALRMVCMFELDASRSRLASCRALVRLINQRLDVGHFDYHHDHKTVVFREAMFCPAKELPTMEQAYAMLSHGLRTCESYILAFGMVAEAGLTAVDALSKNIPETQGNA